jgi:hypothetical protein
MLVVVNINSNLPVGISALGQHDNLQSGECSRGDLRCYMTLSNPVIITPRLLPGVKIGKAFVSIEGALVKLKTKGQPLLTTGMLNESRFYERTNTKTVLR